MENQQDWSVTLLGAGSEWKNDCAQVREVVSRHAEVGDLREMPTLAGGTAALVARLQCRVEDAQVSALREALQAIDVKGCDAVLHPSRLHWSRFKLAVFDLDSTLVDCEGIVELAEMMRAGDEVSAITESAMRGEIDFQQSFRKRIALLRGLEESRVRELAKSVRLTPGAELLIRTLIKAGYRTAIATGGFDFIASRLQNELGIHDFCANALEFADGRVTGDITARVIDGEGKAEFVRSLAERNGIALPEVMVVGDGANDIPMMQTAGLSVAFHAKPKVISAATSSVRRGGLDSILYMLQIDREVVHSLMR